MQALANIDNHCLFSDCSCFFISTQTIIDMQTSAYLLPASWNELTLLQRNNLRQDMTGLCQVKYRTFFHFWKKRTMQA
jgi:hypothetical protein